MVDVDPFPFATVEELKARWPDMPAGSEDHAETLLEDASEFILDMVPSAADAKESTRRRVVCAVVRRSMEASTSQGAGLAQFNVGTGPFTMGGSPANPHGDFYLTKNEKRALGDGVQKAFSVLVGGAGAVQHRPWCSLMFGATYCSCGADIAGEPIYEA